MTNDFTKVNITGDFEGKTLAEALARLGYYVTADCGGLGTCGKCEVCVNGETVKSCRYIVPKGGVTAVLQNAEKPAEKLITDANEKTAVLDIGTTTLELGTVKDGEITKTVKMLNPERAHGADVLSRAQFAEENIGVLREELMGAIENLKASTGADIKLACGNPTMMHIFAGVTPKKFGMAPFRAIFDDEREVNGIKILSGSPSKSDGSAFIGSDIIAGAYFADLKPGEILVDLGTNGEMLARSENGYFAASSSCGPCFEGADITCGTGGIEGAIDAVTKNENELCFKTIGDKPINGICGAGLIDLISCLIDKEVINDFGYMKEDYHVTENTYLTPYDIRNFQLAKSAVRSCFEGLLKEAGIGEVSRIYIAGSFGFYANTENMIKVGMFPAYALGKIEILGNTALKGAAKALKYGTDGIKEIANGLKIVNTGEMESFNEDFMKYINF